MVFSVRNELPEEEFKSCTKSQVTKIRAVKHPHLQHANTNSIVNYNSWFGCMRHSLIHSYF